MSSKTGDLRASLLRWGGILSLFLFLLLSGCATFPGGEQYSPFELLADDADLYITLNYEKNRDILLPLKEFLTDGDKNVGKMLDKAERLSASISLKKDQGSAFTLLLEGPLPTGAIQWGLTFSSGWFWERDYFNFWREKEGNIEIAFPGTHRILLSNEGFTGWERHLGPKFSADFSAGALESDIAILIPNPDPELMESIVGPLKVPIKAVKLLFVINDDVYNGAGFAIMENEQDARVFSTLIRFLIIASRREEIPGSLFFRSLHAAAEGNMIILEFTNIPVEDITTFITELSL
ncbi:MAG: hypothetical protein KAU17_10255 [Spirochaetales bacterium]|nr:hypothetical protein [Spirochaetales bacterium]